MANSHSSATTLKRIHREIADIKKEDLGNITLMPSEDDLFFWKGAIPGTEGSCYEGGVFNVDLQLALDYPFSAPKVTFATRIYHMNISDRGNVCIDILKQSWSPALSLFKVMLSLSSLLTDPNPKDPLVPSIAMEFVRNRQQHDQTARQWTELYARPKPPVSLLQDSKQGTGQKQKGKKRDLHPMVEPSAVASSSTLQDTISIEDSDDEGRGGQVSPRRNPTRKASRKRKREGTITEIDLTRLGGEDDSAAPSLRISSRSASRFPEVEGNSSAGASGPGTIGNQLKRQRTGKDQRPARDVIIIDD